MSAPSGSETMSYLERIANMDLIRNRGFSGELRRLFKGVELTSILGEGKVLLELGAGKARTVQAIAHKYGCVAYAVDLQDYRSEAEKARAPSVTFLKGDILDLTNLVGNEFADFVFSYACFQYLLDPLKGIQQAHQVMKMGATAVIHLGQVKKPGKETINPGIDSILAQYPNQGQLAHDIVMGMPRIAFFLYGEYRIELAYSKNHRIIIHKTSTEPLQLPQLKDVQTPRFTRAYYTL